MITQDAFTTGICLMNTIVRKMPKMRKGRWGFFQYVLFLFLGLKGRINFLQLERYGEWTERTYRNQFSKDFKFLEFGSNIVEEVGSHDCIIAFDPTFLRKSGKKTSGLGYFYNGSHGRYEKGLEFSGIAAVDLNHGTAYHLEAVQSPTIPKKHERANYTLIDHYANVIITRSDNLLKISNYLVVDAYFTKIKFVDPIRQKTDLHLVGRLRDDANVHYLFHGPRRTGKGRPRKYAGKIDVNNIDRRRLKCTHEDDQCRISEGIVYSAGLKRNIKLAYVEFLDADRCVTCRKLFFCTDFELSGRDILKYYQARYQVEFLFRDAKQHTGIEHCQARSPEKLHFHINTSLSAVSMAKAIIRKQNNTHEELVLSISDIQTELHNRLLAERIFSIYQIEPNIAKNKARYREILDFGKIAA